MPPISSSAPGGNDNEHDSVCDSPPILPTTVSDYIWELPHRNDTESLAQYRPGGLHPVHISDVYPVSPSSSGRKTYRILNKLGFGGHSHIWLAEEIGSMTHAVALKFNVAASTGKTNEVALHEYLKSRPQDDVGFRNILTAADTFQVEGPNGIHMVIVTDAVAFVSDLCTRHVIENLDEVDIIRQIFQGVSFLHNNGVVHRELHCGNIAIEFPFFRSSGINWLLSLANRLDDPLLFPCMPCDPLLSSTSVPKYIVAAGPFSIDSTSMREEASELVVKLVDFGCAFRPGTDDVVVSNDGVPRALTPPECLSSASSPLSSPLPWSYNSDIWTLGCTLVELFSRKPNKHLFGASNSVSLGDEIAGLLGPVPQKYHHLLDDPSGAACYDGTLVAENWRLIEASVHASRLPQSHHKNGHSEQTRAADNTTQEREFLSMIKQMLIWNPDNRISADEALNTQLFRQRGSSVLSRHIPPLLETGNMKEARWGGSWDRDPYLFGLPDEYEETTEQIYRYRPGGLHPVHLDDRFTSSGTDRHQYRILHKLGFGSYSSVWFGQNVALPNRGVVLKFVAAQCTGKTSEVEINKYLASRSNEELGFRNFLFCHDTFQVDGPNGIHNVIVADPAILLSSLPLLSVEFNEVEIIRQIFSGVAFLHKHGVVHRDLHLGNIAVEFPFLRRLGVNELMKASGHPLCHPCVPRQTSSHPPSLPTYLVEQAEFCESLWPLMQAEASQIVVKLLDFGCALRPGINDILEEDQGGPALSLRAPECVISTLLNIPVHKRVVPTIGNDQPDSYADSYAYQFFLSAAAEGLDISAAPLPHGPNPESFPEFFAPGFELLSADVEGLNISAAPLPHDSDTGPGSFPDFSGPGFELPTSLQRSEAETIDMSGSWSTQSDIWALGCTLIQLFSRMQHHMFQAAGAGNLIRNIAGYLGQLPPDFKHMLEDAATKKFPSPGWFGPAYNAREAAHASEALDIDASRVSPDAVSAKWEALEHTLLNARAPKTPGDADEKSRRVEEDTRRVRAFLALIKQMLRWNPSDRISASDALDSELFNM
ncbi:kinase-like domain-containing protein [Mycena vitilis]|nr:kinase-like domain-containing protein [Mycena vitilis]